MAWEGTDINEDEGGYTGEFWEPLEGEKLQGTVQKIKKGKFDKLFMVIMDSEGESWFTPQHAHLDRQIQRLQKPPIELVENDTVMVEYLGTGKQPDDPTFSPPHLYKLQVWRE